MCLLVSILKHDLFLTLTPELGSVFLEPMLRIWTSLMALPRGEDWSENPRMHGQLHLHISAVHSHPVLSTHTQHRPESHSSHSAFLPPMPDPRLPPTCNKVSDGSKNVCHLAPICRNSNITIPLGILKHHSFAAFKRNILLFRSLSPSSSFFFFFLAAPAAHGSSQARDQI